MRRAVTIVMSPDREIERIRTFTRVMDRYGLDPILGFVFPVVGDVIGSLVGLYIVGVAIRRRMSKVLVARMLVNLGIDMLVGVIPFVGDIADIAFKANTRNLKLLESRSAIGKTTTAGDWAVVIGAVLAFVAAIGGAVYALVLVIRALS
jgi:hypothetical protein